MNRFISLDLPCWGTLFVVSTWSGSGFVSIRLVLCCPRTFPWSKCSYYSRVIPTLHRSRRGVFWVSLDSMGLLFWEISGTMSPTGDRLPPFGSPREPLDKRMTLASHGWLVWLACLGTLLITSVCNSVMVGANKLETSKLTGTWTLPNQTWCMLLASPKTNFDKLNHRWFVNFAAGAWVQFWKKA